MKLSFKQFNLERLLSQPKRSNPTLIKSGENSFSRTIAGKVPNAPVALVKRGLEVQFHNVPFVDENGNSINLDTKRIGSRTIVRVKSNSSSLRFEKKISVKGDSSFWKEQWLSLNKSVDQAIPNFKQLANVHLRETRELRRGILMGKIETPGRKLNNNNPVSGDDGSFSPSGYDETDALAEFVAAARLAAGRSIPQQRTIGKKYRSDDSMLLNHAAAKPFTKVGTSRQAILGTTSRHRKEGDQGSLPLGKPIKKFEPPTINKGDISFVVRPKDNHQVFENRAAPSKTPGIKSLRTASGSIPQKSDSRRSITLDKKVHVQRSKNSTIPHFPSEAEVKTVRKDSNNKPHCDDSNLKLSLSDREMKRITKQNKPDGQIDQQVKMMIHNGWRIHTPRQAKNKQNSPKREERVSPQSLANIDTKITVISSRNFSPSPMSGAKSLANQPNSTFSDSGMQAVVTGIQNLQEVLNKIHGRAQLLTQNSSTILQVQLKPQNLGILLIEISEDGGKYDVTVKARSPEAIQAIEAQTEQIRQQLHQSGVDIVKFEVSADDSRLAKHQGNSDEKKQTGNKPSQNEKSEQDERVNWTGLHQRGLALGTNTVDFIG